MDPDQTARSQSNSGGFKKIEQSELDWLQVYNNDTLMKIV